MGQEVSSVKSGVSKMASESIDGKLFKKRVRDQPWEKNRKALEVVNIIGNKILKEEGLEPLPYGYYKCCLASKRLSPEQKIGLELSPEQKKDWEPLCHVISDLEGLQSHIDWTIRNYPFTDMNEEDRKIIENYSKINNLERMEILTRVLCQYSFFRPKECEVATKILSEFEDYYPQGYFAEGEELSAEPALAIEKGLKEVIEEESYDNVKGSKNSKEGKMSPESNQQ